MKNTGMAVTIDVGNPTNVHPKNKQPLATAWHWRLERLLMASRSSIPGRFIGCKPSKGREYECGLTMRMGLWPRAVRYRF